MISFKIKASIFFLLFIVGSAFAQKAEKTLVKSFNVDGQQEVTLNLSGEVEVKHWNNKVMRVQMTISLGNGSVHMLKSLIVAGRYKLDSKTEDDALVIYAPNISRQIKLRGQALEEKIEYTIFAPEHLSILLKDDSSASNEQNSDNSSL